METTHKISINTGNYQAKQAYGSEEYEHIKLIVDLTDNELIWMLESINLKKVKDSEFAKESILEWCERIKEELS